MASSEGITIALDDDNDDQEEDLHLCGKCRSTFANIAEFFQHKKACSGKKSKYIVTEKKSDPDELNLATDEAAVISLLANQLSSQNSQPKPSDDLEGLTLVFKDELDDVEPDQIEIRLPTKKNEKGKKKVQTTSVKTSNNQTKTSVKLTKSDRKLHPCTVLGCKYAAQHPKDLTRHLRMHTGEKPFSCKYCNKSFSRQDKVKNHERIHTGEKPYVCQLCPYETADSGSLRKHMRIHTDERPFSCQLCPYRSRDSSQLTVHLRTHTNDRPFVCPFDHCETAFKTNSDLKRHLKLHKCAHCEFSSSNQVAVRSHMTSEHPELLTALKCKECNFGTSNEIKLKSHMRTHRVASKEFVCEVCGFSTETELRLASHIKKKHSNEDKTLHCMFCDFQAPTQAVLVAHRKKKHALKKSPKKKEKANNQTTQLASGNGRLPVAKTETAKTEKYVYNYSCSICEAMFVREDSLKSHLRQHKQQKSLLESTTNMTRSTTEDIANVKTTSNEATLSLDDDDPSVQYLLFPSTTSGTSSTQEIHILSSSASNAQVIYQAVTKED